MCYGKSFFYLTMSASYSIFSLMNLQHTVGSLKFENGLTKILVGLNSVLTVKMHFKLKPRSRRMTKKTNEKNQDKQDNKDTYTHTLHLWIDSSLAPTGVM